MVRKISIVTFVLSTILTSSCGAPNGFQILESSLGVFYVPNDYISIQSECHGNRMRIQYADGCFIYFGDESSDYGLTSLSLNYDTLTQRMIITKSDYTQGEEDFPISFFETGFWEQRLIDTNSQTFSYEIYRKRKRDLYSNPELIHYFVAGYQCPLKIDTTRFCTSIKTIKWNLMHRKTENFLQLPKRFSR